MSKKETGVGPPRDYTGWQRKFEHGVTVRHVITGFTGVVTGFCDYMTGCKQYLVAPPKLDKDGQPVKSLWLDEDALEINQDEAQILIKGKTPGGPQNHPSRVTPDSD